MSAGAAAGRCCWPQRQPCQPRLCWLCAAGLALRPCFCFLVFLLAFRSISSVGIWFHGSLNIKQVYAVIIDPVKHFESLLRLSLIATVDKNGEESWKVRAWPFTR